MRVPKQRAIKFVDMRPILGLTIAVQLTLTASAFPQALPPARLEVAADFVHRLKRISEEERQAIFTRTAGALSPEEADELERVIEEGCEQIDEHGW